MPFKRDLALQNISFSKQSFKMQPQIENEEVSSSPQYNMLVTRTNKSRALSLQRSGVRWLIFNSSHCLGNMYHIIYARVLVRVL